MDVRIFFNGGIVSMIIKQMISSFRDFNGFLLGDVRIIKGIQNDVRYNLSSFASEVQQSEEKDSIFLGLIIINVTDVIFTFSSNFKEDNEAESSTMSSKVSEMNSLATKKGKKIVGLFCARLNSVPIISLKEQMRYKETLTELKKDKAYDNFNIIYAAFSHAKNKDKTIEFNSRTFVYNNTSEMFDTLNYEVNKLKKNEGEIQPLENKVLIDFGMDEFSQEILKLKDIIKEQFEEIEKVKEKLFRFKKLVMKETENYNVLKRRMRMYGMGERHEGSA